MSDLEALYQALRNADKAGDTQAAKKIASYIQQSARAPEPPPQEDLLHKIQGTVIETPLALATGAGASG